jgi:putative membrane protein
MTRNLSRPPPFTNMKGNQEEPMRTNWIKTGLFVGLLLSGGVAFADARPAGSAATQHENGDQEFLEQALGVNQLELQLGQLATKRATTAEVKAMGTKMVEKHTELGQQLAALARQAGGSGEPKLSSDQRAIYDRVASQSGGAFDPVFKEVVDAGHVKELAMYQAEASRATSPELRDLAQRRAAKLKETVAQAEASKPKPAPSQDW